AEDKRKELSGIADGLLSWRKQSESRSRIEAALSLAGSFLDIDVTALDQGKWLLNCQNGTLDLRTRKLRPHRRSDFITRCVPVAYDPSATCPTWEAFLDRIFDNRESLVRFQQKALGYSLTGDTREKCIFILYGPKGDNGKSTLLQAISTLLARYATEAAPELLMARKSERHPTEIADLHGARLVTALETGKRRSLNENLVKQMTGCGDKLKGRYMRQDFFEFYPEFKLFLATNHKPVIRGTDNAIWNRIRLIPFEVSIPKAEQDKNLPAKLQAELPGILNWAVEGCRLWLAEGMEPPEEVENATTGYREEMDVLAGFLADHCFIGEKATASAKDLYETYCKWCETNGEVPETQRSFGMSLTERGFERYRNNGMNWKGIGLKGEVF
nr:phage/plasmid primase, P4 family [Pseudomonadota bacterium]